MSSADTSQTQTVVVCAACGYQNAPSVQYCGGCRVPLERGARVSLGEAERMRQERVAVQRRRRFRRMAAIVAVAVAAGAIAFWTLGPGRSLPPPLSDVSSTPSSADDWPMYQRDPAHTSATESLDAPLEGRVVWRFDTAAPFESSPAVVDGVVYVSTGDRRVAALDARSGGVIWQREVSGPVASSPAVAGDMLYVGLKDGRLLAMATADGAPIWEFQTGDLVYTPPTVANGVVYLGSGDKKLHALDAQSGDLRWSYESEGRIQTGAAVGDEVVAVVSQDRRVHILDAYTGRHRLDYVMSAESRASAAIDENHVYAADSRGVVLGIDWKQKELPFEKTARWIRVQLFVWALVDTLPPQKGYSWVFHRARQSFLATPALAGDLVIAASSRGVVYALHRDDGEVAWEYAVGAPISGEASVAGGAVYVGDADGVVHVIDAQSGEARSRLDFAEGAAITSTPVVAGGALYATAGGVLYAVR